MLRGDGLRAVDAPTQPRRFIHRVWPMGESVISAMGTPWDQPGGRLARESPGRRSNKARRLCVARRRRGVVRWSEGEARWGRGHGDAPKPSIAAGAPGSDVTWRLPRRRLAWAQTEGIVEDVEPRTEND